VNLSQSEVIAVVLAGLTAIVLILIVIDRGRD
jgi:hypothetical protein